MLLTALFIELTYGDIQSNKYVYMWQCYYAPWVQYENSSKTGKEVGAQNRNPPKDYTGTWRRWDRDGNLIVEADLKAGLAHGTIKHYVRGKIFTCTQYEDDFQEGFEIRYHENLNFIKSETTYSDDVEDGFQFIYSKEGTLLKIIIHNKDEIQPFIDVGAEEPSEKVIYDKEKKIDYRFGVNHILKIVRKKIDEFKTKQGLNK